MHTAFRELPLGARQQQAHGCITSEQRTEDPQRLRRLRRVRPITRFMSAGESRNKSGTAEEFSPLSLITGDNGVFLLLWRGSAQGSPV